MRWLGLIMFNSRHDGIIYYVYCFLFFRNLNIQHWQPSQITLTLKIILRSKRNQSYRFCRTEPVNGCKYVNKGGSRETKCYGVLYFYPTEACYFPSHLKLLFSATFFSQHLYQPRFFFFYFTYVLLCVKPLPP